jgi:hypothetical protein
LLPPVEAGALYPRHHLQVHYVFRTFRALSSNNSTNPTIAGVSGISKVFVVVGF